MTNLGSMECTKKRREGQPLDLVKGLYWFSSSALNRIFHVTAGISTHFQGEETIVLKIEPEVLRYRVTPSHLPP